MLYRLRSSITMSRKSIESSSSWSRRGTSLLRWVRSSSGAITLMICRTACLICSFVISRRPRGRPVAVGAKKIHELRPFYNNYRVDAQHAGRIVEDMVHHGQFFRGVQHQIRDLALGVQVIHVDGRVDEALVESRQISSQCDGARGSHGVAAQALGVVDMRLGEVA